MGTMKAEGIAACLPMLVLGLAGGAIAGTLLGARGPARWRRGAAAVGGWGTGAAVGLLGLGTALAAACEALDLAAIQLGPLHWLALAAAVVAVTLRLWEPTARFPLAGLYGLALAAVILALIQEGYRPGRFFLWAGLCNYAGFLLAAAVLGWYLPRAVVAWDSNPGPHRVAAIVHRGLAHGVALLRIPPRPQPWPRMWFWGAQAILAGGEAALTAWVAIDFAFDGMGQGLALFGLAGRLSGCPAALMLLGAVILMAWQTDGVWRAGWQYAALAAGVLLTSSLGWAQLDPATAVQPGDSPWLHRSETLLISAAMMTLLTSFGLPRVLPRSGDWLTRARRAAPFFAGLVVLLVALVVWQKFALLAAQVGAPGT